jgi:chromosome segregation ATPase
MMSSGNQYGRDLEQAMDELSKMLAQREELEVQIARTKRKVALLAQLCEETDELVPIPDLDLGGLTEACRTALRASRKEWMNTTEIMAALGELGFPLDKYKAPTASITTTVNRMVESGDVIPSPKSNPGATEYKWVGWSNKPAEFRGFAAAVEQKKRKRP